MGYIPPQIPGRIYVASDDVITINAPEDVLPSMTTGVMKKIQLITLLNPLSQFRFKFDCYATGGAGLYKFVLYKNGYFGTQIGTARDSTTGWQTWTEDIMPGVTVNDTIELWALYWGVSQPSIPHVRNLYICGYGSEWYDLQT